MGAAWWRGLACILLLGGAGGCAGALGGLRGSASTPPAPAWVVHGGGRHLEGGRPVFDGVGQGIGVKSAALARNSAENRARAEVARSFEVYAAQVVGAYMRASGAAEAEAQGADDARAENFVKALCAASLAAAVVVDHVVQPQDGSQVARVQLPLQAVLDSLPRIKDLDDPLREFIQAQGVALFHAQP